MPVRDGKQKLLTIWPRVKKSIRVLLAHTKGKVMPFDSTKSIHAYLYSTEKRDVMSDSSMDHGPWSEVVGLYDAKDTSDTSVYVYIQTSCQYVG